MYMHELRDRRQKHYPPELIDEKRTIGGGATVCDNRTAKLITEMLRLLTATGLATVMTAAQSRTAKQPEALAAATLRCSLQWLDRMAFLICRQQRRRPCDSQRHAGRQPTWQTTAGQETAGSTSGSSCC